ncbi:molybdopterin molybdotransferase MoeA [Terrimonas sp. NA20]|uniref:Molybdopterin molybdenumtransferase n=1 Tax=Terrimonas ginsenosidimutans TaxID=2908004 RepID=A0ABS9KP69_9BACT|nr:molybdopterin molybdotransferase MoeA [Terrimonas ginsenosidimutans]MCG2614094.1 molybdopterin molybdotransferase MoeA [Terrimonas ginsenosidimutans]
MIKDSLIAVEEAKAILRQQEYMRKTVQLPLKEAGGRILATSLIAPVNIPAFDQSSMDGYAFAYDAWKTGDTLRVIGEVPAGRKDLLHVNNGEAMRVFTGAPLPDGTDTVIMQEHCSEENGILTLSPKNLKAGDNRRRIGTDIRHGDLALPANSFLNDAAVGFLAGLGFCTVPVYATPAVALVITGDELQQPGEPLDFGQVYEASSTMLQAALTRMGISQIKVFRSPDILEETIQVLQTALSSSDVVLLTGGVSVGNYDFVVKAAEHCGVQKLFHRVKQRPGKPLFAGRKDDQPVFGLPGNPSSVLTCFYQYVWPVLRKFSGHPDNLVTFTAPLSTPFEKTVPLTQFLKAVYKDGVVEILSAQESYRMSSFAVCNCLVELKEEVRNYNHQELVTIHLLPSYG